MLWISQLHQLVSGEDEGKCHTDFLWFANLGFAGKKNGEEKKKGKKPHNFIFILKPLNSSLKVY